MSYFSTYKLQAKYDNKKRKQKEKKTESLCLRMTRETKDKFLSIVKEGRMTQTEVFRQMVDKGKVEPLPYAKEVLTKLEDVNCAIGMIWNLLKDKKIDEPCRGAVQEIYFIVENIKDKLYVDLKNNGKL
jgi:hypothetical protein